MTTTSSLMAALGFTATDLAANRTGALTDGQKADLKALGQKSIRPPTIAFGVFFAILLMSFFLPAAQNGGFALVMLIFGLVLVLFLRPALQEQHAFQADIKQGVVAHVSGTLEYDLDSVFQIAIGEDAFRVEPEAVPLFEEGKLYTLYYAPYSHQLLSAEMTGSD